MSAQGAYILGCRGTWLRDREKAFFADANPWGFILFARNMETPAQVRALCTDLRQTVGRNAPILIDQEGGRVQRMERPYWRKYLPPLDQITRSAPEDMVRGMYLRARLIAAELHSVGIDVNCAPVADIITDRTHRFLRNRCYGADAQTVLDAARAVAQGSLDGGVLPVMKHVPGHGRAFVDSHHEPPHVNIDLNTLAATDFVPFAGLSDLPLAMTGHMIFDQIDPGVPTTASAKMVRIIRDMIRFDGLLMTDDISMEALSGTVADRSLAAIRAGVDISLHCNGNLDQMESVAETVGLMTPAAQARADGALAQRRAPDAIDVPALEEELNSLVEGAFSG
ncbi:glycoside hydrolase family 3 N-terminal domain-containing protein [Actibacterium sp. 188UL27-1]|uniref:glycoside hydrolase family 3 N-terminal domain-containing protein n=1 Tax=Actibacterium sp. 188UL27-1 TaxID=2786961 RepID=UPI00351C4C1B